MYNHTTTLFFVLSVAALIKGVLDDKGLFVILSGAIIGFNIFMRIPNVVEIIIILSVIYWGVYKKDFKKTVINFTNFIFGFIVAIIISLLIINSVFGMEGFIKAITKLSTKAQTSTSGYSMNDMIRANLLLGFQGIFYLVIFQVITFIIIIFK